MIGSIGRARRKTRWSPAGGGKLAATIVIGMLYGGALAGQVTPASGGKTDTAQVVAAERFIGWLRTARFDSAALVIEPAVPKGAMSESSLRRIWSDVTASLGDVVTVASRRTSRVDTLTLVELGTQFREGRRTIRVVLTPKGLVTGLFFLAHREPYRPPPYADEATFSELPMTVGSAPRSLPGTLSLPKTGERLPAVVLLHGSGPNDRDGTYSSQRPLRDLAWGLASRGIAALRYDKRTLIHRAALGGADVSLEQEVIDDALAAIQLLRSQPRIDTSRIFVVGHSLGGFLAPEIALKDGRVRGAALLAVPARSIDLVLRDQLRFAASLDSTLGRRARLRYDSLLAIVDSLTARTLPPGRGLLGAPAAYYYELMRRSAVAIADSARLPLFVAHGGRDYQVPDADRVVWQAALANNPRATHRSYPRMNHLLLPSGPQLGPADYEGEQRHVDVALVDDLVAWIGGIGARGTRR